MTSYTNALEIAINKMQMGEISAAEANVLVVRLMGVRLITSRIPADVRKALNEAVKTGELGHIKKDGLKPEAYHHKNGRARALEARNEHARNINTALAKVCAPSRSFLEP